MGICIYADQLDYELIAILCKEYGEGVLDLLDNNHHIMIMEYVGLTLYTNGFIGKSDIFYELQEFKDSYYALKLEQIL